MGNKKKTLESKLVKLHSNVWHVGMEVPKQLADELRESGVKRVLCTFPDGTEHSTKVQFLKADGYFINVNSTIRKKLDLEVGSKIKVTIEPEENAYGMPVPPIFLEMLKQDNDAAICFHRLTPGKQRNLIYLVAQPKSEEIQLRRGLIILEYLKSTDGTLDFKALHAAIKEGNHQA